MSKKKKCPECGRAYPFTKTFCNKCNIKIKEIEDFEKNREMSLFRDHRKTL